MATSSSRPNHAVVGFALLPKKVGRVLTPALQKLANESGISLIAVDPDHPPANDVELRAVVHKVPDHKGWEAYLRQLMSQNPGCKVLDPPDSIKVIRSRVTQLQCLQQGQGLILQAGPREAVEDGVYRRCTVHAPRQVTVQPGMDLEECEEALKAAGMQVPVAMKVIAPEGDVTAHEVKVLRSSEELQEAVGKLQHPAVLQEFVPHLPVVFKVYVLGGHIHIDIRRTISQATTPTSTHASTDASTHADNSQRPKPCSPSPSAHSPTPTIPAAGVATMTAASAPLPHTASTSSEPTTDLAHPLPPTSTLATSVPPHPSLSAARADEPRSHSHDSQRSHSQDPQRSHTQGPSAPSTSTGATDTPASQRNASAGALAPGQATTTEHPAAQQYASAEALTSEQAASLLQQAVHAAAQLTGWGVLKAPLPEWVARQLGCHLSQALGLTMFNFDVLVPLQQTDPDFPSVYVVDINYFPGYDKISGWEGMMVDLLVGVCEGGN